MNKKETTFRSGLIFTAVFTLLNGPVFADQLVRFDGKGDTVYWVNVGKSNLSLNISNPDCKNASHDLAPGEQFALSGLADGRYKYEAVAQLSEPPRELQKIRDEYRGQGYCLSSSEQSGNFMILEGQYVDPQIPEGK